jgi:hypothetical protein
MGHEIQTSPKRRLYCSSLNSSKSSKIKFFVVPQKKKKKKKFKIHSEFSDKPQYFISRDELWSDCISSLSY